MKISKEKLKEILGSDEIQKLIYGELNRGHSIELKVEKNNFVVVYIPLTYFCSKLCSIME